MDGYEDRAATEASLLLAVLFLGTNPVAVKVAVGEIPPLPFVAMRFTLAGLLLLGLVRLLSPEGLPGGKDLLSMAGVGFLGVGLNNVAFTLGVSLTTASETALIYAAVPVWGMILGSFLGLERPTSSGVFGVVIAIGGSSLSWAANSGAHRASRATCWWSSPRYVGAPTPCSPCGSLRSTPRSSWPP